MRYEASCLASKKKKRKNIPESVDTDSVLGYVLHRFRGGRDRGRIHREAENAKFGPAGTESGKANEGVFLLVL
jgi:hypothetical protein